LSEQLEEQYSWKQALATIFVLTGRIPLISLISSTQKWRSRSLLNRIVLEVDPTVSPKEVAENYRNLRKEMMSVRPRKLSEKHMQLAIFNMKYTKGETWAMKMAEWNKEQRIEWRYKEVSNFALDCRQARTRLLGPS
jgi:hypothetical protein